MYPIQLGAEAVVREKPATLRSNYPRARDPGGSLGYALADHRVESASRRVGRLVVTRLMTPVEIGR